MCQFGEIEEIVVCDNNNDREFPILRPARLYTSSTDMKQISSATSTHDSNTKTVHRKPAMR